MVMEMDIVDIERILPHRYPFLMVDRIIELEPGKRADLIVVSADPLDDIAVLYDGANIAVAMCNGLKAVPRQGDL